MASHYQCAFCDKFHTEVRLLIEAEKGCICDSCVLTCTELMTKQLGKDWPKKVNEMKAALADFENKVGVKPLKGHVIDEVKTLLDELNGTKPEKKKKREKGVEGAGSSD